ncbi:MAG: TonB-dependent receptor [Saprospiraceae bacterium]|nr:TonB-dependent receptor [Candidatus Vicinibacter proximus]MBL7824907.1 TonB-dependent receptor [Saprospiraceae bacterium]MCC6841703.1 TonB-dependent receptor [Saprospiraceae bacterium]HRG33196.1 TonB-dependent receptor [Saprospiraceae bacterium]
MLKCKLILILLITTLSMYAQSATIQGTILDKTTKEPIIGATIMVEGSQTGTTSDFDGKFTLRNLTAGKLTVAINYIGYKKVTKEYTLDKDSKIEESWDLEEESTVLADVVVIGKVNKQNASAITLLQQKSSSMVSGISNEDIKKSPDRNTSDVLKRVSGASIQENKFVIIRGLADRYNNALLNANVLPSTEPDRRSFNFDLFPSSVLTNLVIYKTATPDLPGEFAGGIVQVNTKEVSENPFVEMTVGTGINSISTFKSYNFYEGGNTDWLGYDKTKRSLDPNVTKEALSNNSTRYENSRLVANDWKVNNYSSMMPSQNLQLSAGKNFNVFGKKLGILGALSYQNTNRILQIERNDFNIDKTQLYAYQDAQYKKQYNNAGLLNATLSLNSRNKISLNNLMTVIGDDQYIERIGHDIEQTRQIKAYSMLYTSTFLFTNQLIGEHEISKSGTLLKWALSRSEINRNTPSYRRMTYIKNDDAEPTDPYYAYIPIGAPSPNYAGRFYSDQAEKLYTGRIDLSLPIRGNDQNQIKFGAFSDMRDRSFDARVFGYTYSRNYVAQELLTQGIGDILDHKNINENGFVLKESTNPNDSYDASSANIGGYAMLDHHFFGDKIRFIGGLRLEAFNQKLNTYEYGGSPISINSQVYDFLPSVNLVYKINETSNLRLSGSQTVVRPNFRELAPFSFYDFNLSAAIVGNPNLKRTQIMNYDLKFEKFFSSGQHISASAFVKKFKNPVEQLYETLGAGTRNFLFTNADAASNYGVEFEARYNLGQITPSLNNFQFRTNLAWINSMVDLSKFAGQNQSERPLQGQSPYLINFGLSYQHPDLGLAVNILYNRIGRRIWLVGSNGYQDTYEAPRDLFDLQISQMLGKNFQIKFTVSDLFNQPFTFYQDQNDSKKYDADDTVILQNTFGTNYSLGLTYTIK